jgi:hypothetical protein
MDILESSITFTQGELFLIRQTLDLPNISAKDAKFVSQLQIKIENELHQMELFKQQQEEEKIKQLEAIKSSSKKKSN